MGTNYRPRPELRDRRLHVGLSQEQLAQLLDLNPATVSNWERGIQVPSARLRRALAEALEVDLLQLQRLIDPSTPLVIAPHAVDHWLDLYESLIAAAGIVRQVEMVAIPGLLQTRAYAKSLEKNHPLPFTDEQLDYQVELRMARQAVLERQPDPFEYQVLIHEPILRATVGGHEVMAEQLDHLDTLFHQANVDIRILPDDGRALVARGGFELIVKQQQARPFLAITIDIDGPRYEQRRSLLADAVTMYDHLLGVALSPADSLARIRQHLRSHQA